MFWNGFYLDAESELTSDDKGLLFELKERSETQQSPSCQLMRQVLAFCI